MPYVISSLSRDNVFAVYEKKSGNVLVVKKSILIKGGANVADKKTLITPSGVATEVSKEDLEILKANTAFKKFMERGFIKVLESGSKFKAQDEAEKMAEKDASAQITKEDYKKKGKKAPRTKRED